MIPNSDGQPEPENVREKWSDAARAASAAGRRARGQGTQARKNEARHAFRKAGGKEGNERIDAKEMYRKVRKRDTYDVERAAEYRNNPQRVLAKFRQEAAYRAEKHDLLGIKKPKKSRIAKHRARAKHDRSIAGKPTIPRD